MTYSFYEVAWAQRESCVARTFSSKGLLTMVEDAFIRDELSKGRYDPPIAAICFSMLLELFERTLRSDLGPREGEVGEPEDVC